MNQRNQFNISKLGGGQPEGTSSPHSDSCYSADNQLLEQGQSDGAADASPALGHADGEILNLSRLEIIRHYTEHLQRLDTFIHELKVERDDFARQLSAFIKAPSEQKQVDLPSVLRKAAYARTADRRGLIRSRGEWFYVQKYLSEQGLFDLSKPKDFIDALALAGVPAGIMPSRQSLYQIGAGFGNTKRCFPNWKMPEEMRRSTFNHAVEIGEWMEKHLKI